MLNLFFKFRFILVLACLKNYKRHDAKFCSVKCFERVHVLQMSPVQLQMSPVHVLQMSPVHVLQMSPVHVLQMSPVHVLQMSPVHVLQMSPVHVLQMSPVPGPVHVLQMSPVQVLQNESSPCFTNESSPGFTSPVQSMFYNMPKAQWSSALFNIQNGGFTLSMHSNQMFCGISLTSAIYI